MGSGATARLFCQIAACFCFASIARCADADMDVRPAPNGPVKDANITLAQRTDADSITMLAKLANCTDATITVSATYVNLKTRTKFPFTTTSGGKTSFMLFTLTLDDDRLDTSVQCSLKWTYGHPGTPPARRPVIAPPFRGGPYAITQGWMDPFTHSKGSGHEYAVDWTMPEGTPVLAALPGQVVALRSDCDGGGVDLGYRDAVNFVVLRHADGTYAMYSHLMQNGVSVALGDAVGQDQPIGFAGATGFCTGPHLHFEIYNPIDGERIQSYPFLVRLADGSTVEPAVGQQHTGPSAPQQE